MARIKHSFQGDLFLVAESLQVHRLFQIMVSFKLKNHFKSEFIIDVYFVARI